jgi:XTP/dITP diphosphohydrolase
MTLYCATTNPGKLREFRHAVEELAPGRFAIEPLPCLAEIPPSPEDGDTFEANAIQKALYYSLYEDAPVFAEDSGLEVDALGGAPGVYSARFAGEEADPEANNDLLLEKLRGAASRTARYRCVIALVDKGQLIGTFEGAVEGEIAGERQGADGFGYDPVFYYPPFGCTFGVASPEQKLSVSHRGEAFRKLLGFLKSRI